MEDLRAVIDHLGGTASLVGHSSGASLAGGLRIAKRLVAAGKPGVIVTLFPDRAERYFEAPVPPKLEKSAT